MSWLPPDHPHCSGYLRYRRRFEPGDLVEAIRIATWWAVHFIGRNGNSVDVLSCLQPEAFRQGLRELASRALGFNAAWAIARKAFMTSGVPIESLRSGPLNLSMTSGPADVRMLFLLLLRVGALCPLRRTSAVRGQGRRTKFQSLIVTQHDVDRWDYEDG